MRLHQHPDFRDAIVAASNYFAPKGISTQLIEKDYYVTEALRMIALRWQGEVILFQQPEVRTLLESGEYRELKLDCDRISRASFGDSYTPPPELSFRNSLALFPDSELQSYLSQEYTLQCRPLCYGDFPTWEEIVGCFESCRAWL
jgi:hypothetical protein